MDFIPEIDLTKDEHELISTLRNESFPEHQVPRSYYKQMPNYRCLKFEGEVLIGYMGLDYRVIGVDGGACSILGIIDICIKKEEIVIILQYCVL